MDMKTIPEDFVVNEIYDLKKFEDKQEDRKEPYYYFILKKINYNQIRAVEKVAKIFNTSRKLVHFAGTKDKSGITTQIISVYGIKENNFEKNLNYFNENVDDLFLEFVGKFNGRINLGDNLGNAFEIVARNLSDEEIEVARKNVVKLNDNGVLNCFDSQRFGYANNSHIVGKHVLKNEIEKAVFIVLTSLPQNPKEDHLLFVNKIKENWDEIKNANEEIINEIMLNAPRFLGDEVQVLKQLKKYKNDFPGAFRKIHKKVRTLYINAYQSYIFNETLIELERRGILNNYSEIELVNSTEIKDELLREISLDLMKKDGLEFSDFDIKSMPELKPNEAFREVKIYAKNIRIEEEEEDEINLGMKKIKILFELSKGEYATNVVKQLFLK